MMDMAYEQASQINDTGIWQFRLLSGHRGCLCCCSTRFGEMRMLAPSSFALKEISYLVLHVYIVK
jgi:hypothetical protein